MKNLKKMNKGFSTLEIMLAMVILLLAITAVMGMVFGGQSFSVDSNINNESLYLGQKGIEDARATAKSDFGALTEGSTSDTSNANYRIDRIVTAGADEFTKQVTIIVNWLLGGTHQRPVSLSTIVTSIPALLSGDDCQVPLSDDWSSPKILNTSPASQISVGPGNTATAIAVKRIGMKRYAFITASGTNGQNSFFIVDVTDPKNPTPVPGGSISSSLFLQNELDAIFISGHYAYVMGYQHNKNFNDQGGTVFVKDNIAYIGTVRLKDEYDLNSPKVSQFAIIDITDPANTSPKIKSNISLPPGNEMYVIDVTSPTITTANIKYKITGISNQINLIQIYSDRAYVSTEGFDASGAILPNGSHLPNGGAGFTIYDVKDVPISAPKLIGYFNAPAGHGYGMYTKNPAEIFLGGGKSTLYTLNSTNGISPIVSPLDSMSIVNRLSGVVYSGHYAFLAIQDPNKTFQVAKVADLSNLPIASAWKILGFAGDGTTTKGAPAGGMDCQNDTFYMVTDSPDKALKVIGHAVADISSQILDSNNNVVSTNIFVGTPLHVSAKVTGNLSVPTGQVYLDRFSDATCTNLANTDSLTLDGSGNVVSSTYTPSSTGAISYKVRYVGNSTYGSITSSCQSVSIVAFSISHRTPTVSADKLTVSITNNSTISTYISKIMITWPSVDGKLKNVQLTSPNKNIFTTDVNPTSTTITAFAGVQADRTFSAAQNKNLVLQFQTNPADVNVAHYSVNIEFDNNPTHTITVP